MFTLFFLSPLSSQHWLELARLALIPFNKALQRSRVSRFFSSRTDVQAKSDKRTRGGETREGEHCVSGGRESAGRAISLDLQQFGGKSRSGERSYCELWDDVYSFVHTDDGARLWHSALLGFQSYW